MTFTQQPASVQAGAVISPAITVQLLDAAGNAVTTDGIAVTVALSGSGTLNGTLTQTTVGGVATFNDLSIQQSGQKTLTMSSSGLTSATSQTFTVSPAAAAKTAFVQEPSNTTADAVISPPVTVQVRDRYDNNVPTAGVTVTMSLSSGTGTLTGTVSQTTDASGVATFNNLNISHHGRQGAHRIFGRPDGRSLLHLHHQRGSCGRPRLCPTAYRRSSGGDHHTAGHCTTERRPRQRRKQ